MIDDMHALRLHKLFRDPHAPAERARKMEHYRISSSIHGPFLNIAACLTMQSIYLSEFQNSFLNILSNFGYNQSWHFFILVNNLVVIFRCEERSLRNLYDTCENFYK